MAALHRPALPAPRILGKPRSGALLIAAAGVGLFLIAAFQVNVFSRVTSASYEINALQSERDTLQAHNRELEAEVAALSSLARVDWEARVRLKMEPPRRIERIEVNQPVPERHTLPTRFLAPADEPRPVAGGGSSWLDALWALLPF